jgi:hypothetical protein
VTTATARQRAAEYLTGVRGLTLKAEWAHAMAHLEKRTENRGWPAPEGIDRILINAGKGRDRTAGDTYARLGFLLPPAPVMSAVVVVADIALVCGSAIEQPAHRQMLCRCDPWKADRQYHWQLANVLVLPEPVPCVGRLGLWHPAPEVVAAVAEQLADQFATKENARA